jgi:luciferase family oxidoreductase group 1
MNKVPLSILDLVPVPEGTEPSAALRRVTDLAQLAEQLGYARYWFAEHHAMPSVACSSPEILIAHVATATQRLRVGSGGIMLPNHAPLRVAEHFHTLHALYPQRIDLGIGRAPGGVPGAARALRAARGDQFAAQLAELFDYSSPDPSRDDLYADVRAVPADVKLPPVWLLGSSGASAQMAGAAGLGYAFASHFSPAPPAPAMLAYRGHFQPSAAFPRPHAILGAAVVCAPTDEEAQFLAGTLDLAWLRIQSGKFLPLPSPQTAAAYPYTDYEREAIADYRRLAIIGSPQTVRDRLLELVDETQADEVMVVSNLYGHAERLRSYQLLSKAMS